MIIAASVFTALSPDPALKVVHAGSSDKNPMIINSYCEWANRHGNYMHFFTQEFPVYIAAVHKEWDYQLKIALFGRLPIKML
jgi:hypothetical protein